MAISTYSELKTAVARWLGQRTDISDEILGDFVTLAEAEFNRTLRLSGQVTRADFTVTGRWNSLSSLTVPLVEIRSASITTDGDQRYPLEYLAPEMSQFSYDLGSPAYYTRIGDEIGVFPTPDQVYAVELIYWRTVPDLATNSTNFLLTLAPDLYLYGAVIVGAQYLQDDGLLARVTGLYQQALARLQADEQRRAFGGSSLTVRTA